MRLAGHVRGGLSLDLGTQSRGGHWGLTPVVWVGVRARRLAWASSVPVCCLLPLVRLGFPVTASHPGWRGLLTLGLEVRGLQFLGRPRPLPVPTPGSLCPQCRCRPGFRLKDDGRTCADVDECSTTFPCSQRCINTHGSYKCLCVEGYAPRGGDPHSCKAVTGETGA